MIAKTEEEIKNLRTAGKILAKILRGLGAMSKPGVSTAALDIEAEKLVRAADAVPAFLGYKPQGAKHPYPAALCVSINDEVVHGIPSEKRILKNGDLVMLDLGLSYNGFFSDAAITVCVGEADEKTQKLIRSTEEALATAVAAARAGNRLGDIGAAIEGVAKKYNFEIVRELGGHALGKKPHEKPFVPNFGEAGTGEKITEGMVLAIEPIFSEGSGDIFLDDDQWTYKTVDGSRTAEFEHTILVTRVGAEILTA